MICPECKNSSLVMDYKHGELICKICGYVVEESLIDQGPEWRAFDANQREKRSRGSGAIKDTKVSKGLTTEIDRYDRDVKGGNIEPERRIQLYRIRKLQTRSRMSDSAGRNLSIALPELDRMSSILNISDSIKEECAHLYRKAVNKGYVKGRSIESIIGGIICYVTRINKIPKTLEEVASVSGVSKKEIGRSYKYLLKVMELKAPLASVEDYIPQYASKLKISNLTEEKTMEIIKKAKEMGITAGRGPVGIAAASIFLASKATGEAISKKDLLEISGITLSTLHSRYEELEKKLHILDKTKTAK